MYFPLEVLNQQILSQHPSYLVLSALLEQPFPEFHKAHGNQDLISYLPGKIPIMSSHWCKESDIKTGSVVINIPAPGDRDVLLKRKAKNQIFCLFTTFLLFTQDVWSYCVYIYILIAIYSLEWVRISWESMKSKTKSSGTAPVASDQFWWWILRWDSLGCFPFPTKQLPGGKTHTQIISPLPASIPSQNTASKTSDHSLFPSPEEAAEMLILQLLSTVSWASGQDGLIASLAKRKK